jgi:uncharacterized protein
MIKDEDIVVRKVYVGRALSLLGDGKIKVMTGMRRSGKSCAMRMVRNELIGSGAARKEDTAYLNLVTKEGLGIRTKESLSSFIAAEIDGDKARKHYLFLDEIQECDGFEKALLSALEDYPGTEIFVTGSNSRMQSDDIIRKLGTNGEEIRILPLTFREFKAFREKQGVKQNDKASLADYFRVGGMPSVVMARGNERSEIEVLRKTVIIKDVMDRNGSLNEGTLSRIISCLSEDDGQDFSVENALKAVNKSRSTKLSKEDLERYYGALENCFFLRWIEIPKRGNDILSEERKRKPYVIDHGLAGYIAPNGLSDSLKMESIILNELLYRGYHVDLAEVEDRGSSEKEGDGKAKSSKEIDFDAKKDDESGRWLIQACLTIDAKGTRDREFAPFLIARSNCRKTLILHDDFIGNLEEKYSGLEMMNLLAFLEQ